MTNDDTNDRKQEKKDPRQGKIQEVERQNNQKKTICTPCWRERRKCQSGTRRSECNKKSSSSFSFLLVENYEKCTSFWHGYSNVCQRQMRREDDILSIQRRRREGVGKGLWWMFVGDMTKVNGAREGTWEEKSARTEEVDSHTRGYHIKKALKEKEKRKEIHFSHTKEGRTYFGKFSIWEVTTEWSVINIDLGCRFFDEGHKEPFDKFPWCFNFQVNVKKVLKSFQINVLDRKRKCGKVLKWKECMKFDDDERGREDRQMGVELWKEKMESEEVRWH